MGSRKGFKNVNICSGLFFFKENVVSQLQRALFNLYTNTIAVMRWHLSKKNNSLLYYPINRVQLNCNFSVYEWGNKEKPVLASQSNSSLFPRTRISTTEENDIHLQVITDTVTFNQDMTLAYFSTYTAKCA